MEFFNNKENDILKFKLNSEGVDVNNIEPRLILTTNENKNYLLIGKVEEGVCKFNVPQLNIYEKGDHGKITFEIISEDLYFPVWKDEFEIKTKVNITLEQMITDIQQETTKIKPKISVTEAKVEVQPKVEPEIVKESFSETKKSTVEDILNMKNNFVPIIEEEDEIEVKEVVNNIKKFDSFKKQKPDF
jgi:hypothetical protein